MNDRDHSDRPGLSPRDVQKIRRRLRKLDGKESTGDRVGRIISYPPTPTGNAKRYRFGVSLLLLAIFVMLLVNVLPNDDRRLYFAGFSFVMVAVAAWQIDLAKKK